MGAMASQIQFHHCLLNHLFRCGSQKTSKLHVTGLCEGNSQVTGESPAQRHIYAENVSIWWRHHEQNYTVANEATLKYKCNHSDLMT